MRTWLYVDGYNFYCSLRQGRSHWPISLGWCNFERLAELYLLQPGDRLEKVRYFTSPVRTVPAGFAHERNVGEAKRQRVWLTALRTICLPEDIIRGRQQRRERKVQGCSTEEKRVYREEKMTDVRLAVELVLDALKPAGYEKAIILTSDQDMFPAAQAVKSRISAPQVVEFAFSPDSDPEVLRRYCRAHKIRYSYIKPAMLLNSRFPDEFKDPATGQEIVCPPYWKVPQGLAKQFSWARGY